MDKSRELWDKSVAFHGHVCGGLTIGYKAALYAIELLNIKFSQDEEVVCVTENDACGVDAIQIILGCSVGKGNLLFHMTGKQAYNFYDRKNGKSVRLILKKRPDGMTKEEAFEYYQSLEPSKMFDITEVSVKLPAHARLFDTYECAKCNETTGANWIRIQGGEKLCIDCANKYNRFNL